MSKRALRLHEKHTKDELVQMQRDVLNDPQYKSDGNSIQLMNKKGQRLRLDIAWAIYWHGASKGNTSMAREPLKTNIW